MTKNAPPSPGEIFHMCRKINLPNHTVLLTDSRVQSAFKNILVRASAYKNLEEWNLISKIIKPNTMRKRFCKLSL